MAFITKEFILSYWMISTRLGAYASGIFFAKITTQFMGSFLSTEIEKLAYPFLVGVLLFELIWFSVNRLYAPRFSKQSDEMPVPGRPLLSDEDFEKRARLEKTIYALGAYYAISAIASFAVVFSIISTTFRGDYYLALGLAGLFVQAFNFFGLLDVSAAYASPPGQKALLYIFGVVFCLPLLAYFLFSLTQWV